MNTLDDALADAIAELILAHYEAEQQLAVFLASKASDPVDGGTVLQCPFTYNDETK